MLQRKVIAFFLFLTLATGCSEKKSAISLVGEWKLQVPKGCNYGDVKSDRLILHADGAMEQYIDFADGSNYSSKTEHWKQLSAGDVSLQKRMHVPNNGSREKRGEILLIEPTNPPLILLDPDANCFYEKTNH
jgi:hypothetical protein